MQTDLNSFLGLIIVLAMGAFFAVSNGFRNASLIVSSAVSSRALSPRKAFFICAFFEFLGALLLGSAVVSTIGRRLFGPIFHSGQSETLLVLGVGMSSAFIWGLVSWWRAWPISNSHALMAGLAGASGVAWGMDHLVSPIALGVLYVLLFGPLAALVLGIGLTRVARYLGQYMTPHIKPYVDKLHIGAFCATAMVDGSNDGQLVAAYGVMALGLGGMGTGEAFGPEIFWVRFASAIAITIGVLMGGQKLLKKMGVDFFKTQPIEGVSAQLTTASLVFTGLRFGFPASVSQVMTGALLGAGIAKNPRAVRWPILKDIVMSWVLTIPAVTILSAVIYLILNRIIN